ncbi:hypothetical protein PHLCEN_2v13603 [Hermanssonia centrifuga]|uniref:DUF323 domain-containing protein n=1 Tax=Hermanssonia centrifuga TaxID=98765 RepID=A0A2R6NDX0_9APHY|nr:hypothetical protein PHLCEN_2v13603 [Hermanssonia centrifuga]
MANTRASIDILDIRGKHALDTDQDTIQEQILNGLSRPAGQKTFPTILLYDETGLRLYDVITTDAPEYYLFPAEEQLLKDHGRDIVKFMHARNGGQAQNETVVELGAGALRKTSHILRALAQLIPNAMENPPITYFALDLEKRELERTLHELAKSDVGVEIQGKVATKGLCATYDDGLEFIKDGGLQCSSDAERISLRLSEHYKVESVSRDLSPSSSVSGETETTPPSTPGSERPPFHLLFLGSSLGNFTRGEDVAFLKSLPLQPGSGNTLLIGLDHGHEREKIEAAYNDCNGITKEFIMNGLAAAGRALGDEHLFAQENWEYVNKYNEELRRHEAFFQSKLDQIITDPHSQAEFRFFANELVRIEISHKYSEKDAYSLFTAADLRPINRWTDQSSQYSLWLLERPQFTFPLLSTPNLTKTPFGVPSVGEWQDMWAAWDFINKQMIPPSMLFQKPIDLRHICLFYQGHIPTFLDIHLSRLLQEPHTEPENFKPHSEVPQSEDEWPSMGSIMAFQGRVRARLLKLYDDISSGKFKLTRKVARVLFMTLEHEAFHAETLLYMLLQRAGTGTIPPSGFVIPMWDILSRSWESAPQPPSATVTLGPATLTMGHDDDEADDSSMEVAGHEFGWDNEHPKREVRVNNFRIEWRPITNGEFYAFFTGAGKGKIEQPASWVAVDGELQVRTLYGPVPMKIAWHWPIITSCDNLSTYASVKGGRLPTEPELRLFFDKFNCDYDGGANIGFRNWHPVPSTTGLEKWAGKGHNGGVWEWTSTVFDAHDNFVPSKLYPGYSTDFFDSHHRIVLGGSYATIPRLAERSTVRNYYQHNYPYAWAGARIAYDIQDVAE